MSSKIKFDLKHLLLKKQVSPPKGREPSILSLIPRLGRDDLQRIPSQGMDIWTAWECGWKSPDGRFQTRVMQFAIDSGSKNILESKSLKLYLQGLQDETCDSEEDYIQILREDIAILFSKEMEFLLISEKNLHRIDLCDKWTVLDFAMLTHGRRKLEKKESSPKRQFFVYNGFRSFCPVTGQPDYANILIEYFGKELDEGALLGFLTSFCNRSGFHEETIESIFTGLLESLPHSDVGVQGKFTRRGGIDINPFRKRGDIYELPLYRPLLRQ